MGPDICDPFFENTDLYVYNPFSRQPITLQDLNSIMNAIKSASDLTADDACVEVIKEIVCKYYYIPCVTVSDPDDVEPSVLLMSVCAEECIYVQNTCQQVWLLFETLISISLPAQLGFINCSNPDAAIEPLPNCCVNAGVTIGE